ncbi:HAD family hydrolase [Candidatus Woesearchaeota archaeon]|nr:HAD family hydrolase [Candidatus Woesearchaeota archaeon]
MPIFFDLDDTLINHGLASRQAALEIYESYKTEINSSPRQPYTSEQFIKALQERHIIRFEQYLRGELTFQEQREARFRDVFGSNLSEGKIEKAVSQWMNSYRNHWQLFSDVLPCLDRLAEHQLGIITNADREQQLDKLTATGIINYFSAIICSSDYSFSKPDERIFREACRQMNCDPKQIYFIGDNLEKDARASARAGMRGIWLNRYGKEKAADVEMIGSLDELVI